MQEKGFCKYHSSCKYNHKQPKNVEDLISKMDTLAKQNEMLRSLIIEQNVAINSLIKENSKSIEKLEKKIDLVIDANKEKNDTTETLLKDVKEIKEFVLNLDFGGNEEDDEERLSEVEKEAKGWDNKTVLEKANMFVSGSLKQLEEMETEIKKVRKNSKDIRARFSQYSDKMETEAEKCGLVPSVHNLHSGVTTMVFMMKGFLNQPVTKDDKEEALKVIEEYRQRFSKVSKEISESL